jgi:hypothetical protein
LPLILDLQNRATWPSIGTTPGLSKSTKMLLSMSHDAAEEAVLKRVDQERIAWQKARKPVVLCLISLLLVSTVRSPMSLLGGDEYECDGFLLFSDG